MALLTGAFGGLANGYDQSRVQLANAYGQQWLGQNAYSGTSVYTLYDYPTTVASAGPSLPAAPEDGSNVKWLDRRIHEMRVAL